MILGINAGRCRSGGARAHLIGILNAVDPDRYGIKEIHVWSYNELLDSLPNLHWLIKHHDPALEKTLLAQMWWERFKFPRLLADINCSILLNTDAGSLSRFRPNVTMSRDLLCYEPGEITRYGFSKARLRLVILRFVQNASLKFSDGAVFLTHYAGKLIQDSCGALERVSYIPHGVESAFLNIKPAQNWPTNNERPIRCIYVSNAELYKHQWHVVRAIGILKKEGYNVGLELIGGGGGRARSQLEFAISDVDSEHKFVIQREFVPHPTLPEYLSRADIFVFASSCEAFGITLLEGMAAGLPIACSDRSSLPETLKDGGVYFDPEVPTSISESIKILIDDVQKREQLTRRAKNLSQLYSWERCANELFSFIIKTHKQVTYSKSK